MNLGRVQEIASDPQSRQAVTALFKQFKGDGPAGVSNVVGLVEHLSTTGLAKQLDTWTGSSKNAPITGAQVKQAFDRETIDQVAQDTDSTPDQAANLIAGVVPQLIDSSTEAGEVPDTEETEQVLGQFKQ